jgi:hypothetical protein
MGSESLRKRCFEVFFNREIAQKILSNPDVAFSLEDIRRIKLYSHTN